MGSILWPQLYYQSVYERYLEKCASFFEMVISSSMLPLGDALGEMAYVKSQELLRCIPGSDYHEELCLLNLTHHLLLTFVVWGFGFCS